MVKINIEGLEDINDPFYRYKMEKLDVSSQKNKTEISNLEAIGKDLKRDPELIVIYIKIKMATSVEYKNGILRVSANLTYVDFQKVLREFIEKIVLCPLCKLPEIDLEINGKILKGQCSACSNNVNYNNIIDDKTLRGFIKILDKKVIGKKKLKKSEFDKL